MGKEAVKLFDFSSTFMGGKLTQGMLISEIYDDLYGDQNNSEEIEVRHKEYLSEIIFKVKKYEKKMKDGKDTKNKITFANKVSELFYSKLGSQENHSLFETYQIIKFLYEFNAKNNEVDIISIFDSPYSNDNKYFNVVIDELITIVDKEDNQFFIKALCNNWLIELYLRWIDRANSNIVNKSENYDKITSSQQLGMIELLYDVVINLKETVYGAEEDCESTLTTAQWTMDKILKFSVIVDLERDLKIEKEAWHQIQSIKQPSKITLDKVKSLEKYSINDDKPLENIEKIRQFLFPNRKMDKRKIKRAISYVELFEMIFNSATQGTINRNSTRLYRYMVYLRQYLCLEKKNMKNGKVRFQTSLRKIAKFVRENRDSSDTAIKEEAYILTRFIILSDIQYQNGMSDAFKKYIEITQELIDIKIEVYRKILSNTALKIFYQDVARAKNIFEKHIKENLDYQEKINAKCDSSMNVRCNEYKRMEEDKSKKD